MKQSWTVLSRGAEAAGSGRHLGEQVGLKSNADSPATHARAEKDWVFIQVLQLLLTDPDAVCA